jgi:outer membrane protein assembly factor BamD|tara:strand:+ start:738 stop:1607 length:870 start_codon:yes stop_codon:yes gene_type:complete
VYKAILIIISIFLISCSSNDKEDIVTDQNLYENNLLKDYELYEKINNYIAYDELDLALIEIDKIEVLFPSSKYANKAMLTKAYIYFLKKDYEKTRSISENYKKYYPGSKDIVYANYLEAMTYYTLIKKPNYSQKKSRIALEKFNFILNLYPNSKYEIDIYTKIQIIENNLAASKLLTAKFYLNKKNLNGALVYLKDIYENHSSSLSIDEALYLIVKIYYLIEEEDLAKNYAAILAYNFPESQWYEKSYYIINNNDQSIDDKETWYKKYNPIKIFKKTIKQEKLDIQKID